MPPVTTDSRKLRIIRLEVAMAGFFFLLWGVGLFAAKGWVPLAGKLPLDLYSLYSLASVMGWISGNIYVARVRSLPRYRKRVLLNYLFGPPSFLFVLRSMAPSSTQEAAPLVPLFSFMVYSLLFLVPVTLKVDPGRRPWKQ